LLQRGKEPHQTTKGVIMTATVFPPRTYHTPPVLGSVPRVEPKLDEFPFESWRNDPSPFDQPTRPRQTVPAPYPQRSVPPYRAAEHRAAEQPPVRSRIDQTRFWVGAAITAAVAAVTAVLGTIVAHSILHIPVLSDSAGGPHMLAYALSAAGIAFGAAGLYNAMVHFAPRPRAFFGALSGALIALAVLVPFAITLPLGTQAAFALMNLAVAGVIAILVPLAVTNARR
jgi:hypothetical protein